MRQMKPALVALALSALAACEMRRGPDLRTGSVAQQGVPLASAAVAERPLAHRHEAQSQLDSARHALSTGDSATAIRLLHRAAAFLVIQATEPPGGGTYMLLSASSALDSLAGSIRRDGIRDTALFAGYSARVNLAEAERHESLAGVAWSTRSEESVADELLMAADHLERAATDARLPLPQSALAAIEDMRDIARRLVMQRELDVQSLDEPLAAFHLELRALQRRMQAASQPPPRAR